jgi:YegS/Rv2252/BmrU family lipid kinase
MRKVRIIANPISGKGKSRNLVDELSRELSTRGFDVNSVFTSAKGEAVKAAEEVNDEYVSVCAVGGDGTMNEVLNGIVDKEVHLAVLPAGLSNVLAVELGITAEPKALAEAIAEESTVEIDLCRAGERYFVAMGGAGWDAHIVHQIARSRKSSLGFRGYVLPIARSLLTYKFPNIEVTLDGSTVTKKAGMVIVGNIKQYGGPFKVTNRADFTDGLLDVYIVQRANQAEMLKLFAAILWGDHTRHGNAKYLKGRKLELRSKSEVPVHIDGEAAGHLPKTFEITGRKKRIIVPKQEV